MVVGEGKRRRITVVLGCGRGREGDFGDERLWEFWGGGWWESPLGILGSRVCDLSFGLGGGTFQTQKFYVPSVYFGRLGTLDFFTRSPAPYSHVFYESR